MQLVVSAVGVYWTVVRMMCNTTYMWQIAWFPYGIIQSVYNSWSSEELCKMNNAHLIYVCYTNILYT